MTVAVWQYQICDTPARDTGTEQPDEKRSWQQRQEGWEGGIQDSGLWGEEVQCLDAPGCKRKEVGS